MIYGYIVLLARTMWRPEYLSLWMRVVEEFLLSCPQTHHTNTLPAHTYPNMVCLFVRWWLAGISNGFWVAVWGADQTFALVSAVY